MSISISRAVQSDFQNRVAAGISRRIAVKIFLWLFRLDVARWRAEVQGLWSLEPHAREASLQRYLSKSPFTRSQSPIRALDVSRVLPPVSKAAIKEHTRQADSLRNAAFIRRTAGTTGEPIAVGLSRDELSRMLAVRDYCLMHFGVRLGDREARLWGRSQSGIKPAIKDWILNRRVFYPVGRDAKKVVEDLLSYKPAYVYGYASLILEAAQIIAKYDLTVPPIKCVIATADSLLPFQKEFISKQFDTVVVEEYGSTEFDVVAFDCPDGHLHLVNPWLKVEDRDESALISDVARTTQPFLRYEVGDVIRLEQSQCRKLGDTMIITSLEGRPADRFAYCAKGGKFHAVEFARAVDAFATREGDNIGFSVVQTREGEFTLSVSNADSVQSESLRCWIEAFIEKRTGYQIKVELAQSDIGPGKRNGKRPYFVGMQTTV